MHFINKTKSKSTFKNFSRERKVSSHANAFSTLYFDNSSSLRFGASNLDRDRAGTQRNFASVVLLTSYIVRRKTGTQSHAARRLGYRSDCCIYLGDACPPPIKPGQSLIMLRSSPIILSIQCSGRW